MEKKRKNVEDYIYKHVSQIDTTGTNTDRYKRIFAKMTDKEFGGFINALQAGEARLNIIAPNMKVQIRQESLYKVGRELGIEFHEQLWLTDPATGKRFLSNHKYLILELPVRRLKQYLNHKRSIPESDKRLDYLSNQVVKPDQSARLSSVEVQELHSYGFNNSILELFKVRGGDVDAWNTLKSSMLTEGEASLKDMDPDSNVRSVVVFSNLLRGMHLDNNYFGDMSNKK